MVDKILYFTEIILLAQSKVNIMMNSNIFEGSVKIHPLNEAGLLMIPQT